MTPLLHFLCPNWDTPDIKSAEEIELYMPLYEDVHLDYELPKYDIYDMLGLMSAYSYAGERVYFTLETEKYADHLVRVQSVETIIVDGIASIEYKFENGQSYTPEREFVCDDWISSQDIPTLFLMAKQASEHMFLLDCKLISSDLTFEREIWG